MELATSKQNYTADDISTLKPMTINRYQPQLHNYIWSTVPIVWVRVRPSGWHLIHTPTGLSVALWPPNANPCPSSPPKDPTEAWPNILRYSCSEFPRHQHYLKDKKPTGLWCVHMCVYSCVCFWSGYFWGQRTQYFLFFLSDLIYSFYCLLYSWIRGHTLNACNSPQSALLNIINWEGVSYTRDLVTPASLLLLGYLI